MFEYIYKTNRLCQFQALSDKHDIGILLIPAGFGLTSVASEQTAMQRSEKPRSFFQTEAKIRLECAYIKGSFLCIL